MHNVTSYKTKIREKNIECHLIDKKGLSVLLPDIHDSGDINE